MTDDDDDDDALLRELLPAYEASDTIQHIPDDDLIGRVRAHLGLPPVSRPVATGIVINWTPPALDQLGVALTSAAAGDVVTVDLETPAVAAERMTADAADAAAKRG